MLKDRYLGLAAYNQWANERIYAAVVPLSDDDLRRDCGAFFKSLLGTLNHLLIADQMWMARFAGEPAPPYRLDEIVFADLVALRQARMAEDQQISAFIDRQDDDTLMRVITYRTVSNPMTITQPLAPALDHFFNHQTHHRGQTHALLTRLSGSAPSLDLILLQRERGMNGLSSST